MATLTLEKMAAGGIYDHVGGGFHRYSTDAAWLVPALREDALRQRAARRRLPGGLPGRPGATTSPAWRARCCATSQRDMTVARGRLLLGDRRRQPRPERRAARRAGSSPGRRPRSSAALGAQPARARRGLLRRHRDGQLRGPQHPAHAAVRSPRWPRSCGLPAAEAARAASSSRAICCTRRAPSARRRCATRRSWPPGTA